MTVNAWSARAPDFSSFAAESWTRRPCDMAEVIAGPPPCLLTERHQRVSANTMHVRPDSQVTSARARLVQGTDTWKGRLSLTRKE